MKLRNKKTGEIKDLDIRLLGTEPDMFVDSLAELNEEWEDYKEPKEYWWVDYDGKVKSFVDLYEWQDKMKEIGNYFETKEEAEKAVEKLKAWKRLKDKGFEFDGKEVFSEGLLEIDGVLPALKGADNAERLKIIDDLDLLFGGEE